jgi:uncharacterized membrane protein YkoI
MRTAALVTVLSLGMAAAGLGQQTTAAVPIKEQHPGLLAKAKIQPVDAQNAALKEYPDGTVLRGEILRKQPGNELIYVFEIQPKGNHRVRKITLSAMDGTILTTRPIASTHGMKRDTLPKTP